MGTPAVPAFNLFVPIQRVDEEKRIVEGYCYCNADVGDGWNLTRQALEDAAQQYMEFPAIRAMHQPIAAGTCEAMEFDDGGCFIRAHIVDDGEWKKCVERVYRGFSVGARPTLMRGKDVLAIHWVENSLVDRPKDPDAVFTVMRNDAAAPKCRKVGDGVLARAGITAGTYEAATNESAPIRENLEPQPDSEGGESHYGCMAMEARTDEMCHGHTTTEDAQECSRSDGVEEPGEPQEMNHYRCDVMGRADGETQDFQLATTGNPGPFESGFVCHGHESADAAANCQRTPAEQIYAEAAPSVKPAPPGFPDRSAVIGSGVPKSLGASTLNRHAAVALQVLTGSPCVAGDRGLRFEGEESESRRQALAVISDLLALRLGVSRADKDGPDSDGDNDEPYGDVEYADPGYQADKVKRYPLDTEKHIRAAWSYIHQQRNEDKYSSEDLARVVARIRSAMKRVLGDEDEPESAKRADSMTQGSDLRSKDVVARIERVEAELRIARRERDDARAEAERLASEPVPITAPVRFPDGDRRVFAVNQPEQHQQGETIAELSQQLQRVHEEAMKTPVGSRQRQDAVVRCAQLSAQLRSLGAPA